MAKSPFTKPTIEGPRRRIPVDDAVRAEARAGMGGEQTRLESEGKAAAPSEPVAASASAPAPPEPTPAPAMAAVPTLTSAALATVEPAVAGELVNEEPTAPAAPVLTVAPAPVERRPRGRKPAPVGAQPAGELKGVRISERDWSDIRKILVHLPKGADMPTNIIGYLHTAHKHYEAYLRKTGKLPFL